MGKIYQVVVHGLRGERIHIDLCNTEEQMQSMTVLQLKEKIEEKLPQSEGDATVRLFSENKLLDGDFTLLSEYGIQHMSVIRVVERVRGGGMRVLTETTSP
ncbi:unnamed protein product [Pleuronectes platessa]|uniref:Ubiquitin-like domain-containing protein n=1 Tax=Pleuronectes platessa TaxID=8262 RepID=A0A9N7TYG1_PLEPL|nr:unnamed protein product [Pleuronectes platessa]